MPDCPHAYCLPYGGCQFDSAVHTDEHGNVIDTCGHCTLLPTLRGNVRAAQVSCPVHGGLAVAAAADVARVRTQAERDTDGTTWFCGAFQPTPPRGMKPYRCTDPAGHGGDHRAVIDGAVVATWPQLTRRNP